jgi:hypothetical protein
VDDIYYFEPRDPIPPIVAVRSRGLTESGPRPSRAYHEFYFTRGEYTSGFGGRGGFGGGGFGRGGGGGGGGGWTTDYPKADRQFINVVQRLGKLDICPWEHPVSLDSPSLRYYPYVYILEVGSINLTPAEEKNLREYLLAGGLLIVDDFWGLQQWAPFQAQMSHMLPEYPIKEIPLDDLLFRIFYKISEVRQTPNVRNAEDVSRGVPGAHTWEQASDINPHVRGIYDEKGRLMVVINYNTDLGDAWEWAEDPLYPLSMSTYAMQVGLNMIIYAMAH